MHARWLALPLAALTGCATVAPTTSVRLVPTDLQVGGMAHRTSFELDESSSSRSSTTAESDLEVHDHDHGDDDKKRRRRKTLFWLGTGMAGFGVLGVVGFGVGGRIVQAQVAKGFDEGTLTHEREDQLTVRGDAMNGLAIGSAVIGLAGIIMAATVYGIDHARCGDLPPRRKHCPNRDEREPDEAASTEPASPAQAPAAETPAAEIPAAETPAAEAPAVEPTVGPEPPPAKAP